MLERATELLGRAARLFVPPLASELTDPPGPDTSYRRHKAVSGFAATKRAAKKARGIKRNRLAHR